MQSKMRLIQTVRELQNDIRIQESTLQVRHRPPRKFLRLRQQEGSRGFTRLFINILSREKPGLKRGFQPCLHNAAQAASSPERRQPPFRRGRSRGRHPARPWLSPTEAPTGTAAAPAALTESAAHCSRQAAPQEGARRGTAPRTWVYLRKKTPCTLPDTS